MVIPREILISGSLFDNRSPISFLFCLFLLDIINIMLRKQNHYNHKKSQLPYTYSAYTYICLYIFDYLLNFLKKTNVLFFIFFSLFLEMSCFKIKLNLSLSFLPSPLYMWLLTWSQNSFLGSLRIWMSIHWQLSMFPKA